MGNPKKTKGLNIFKTLNYNGDQKMSWELISKTGVAPIVSTFKCKRYTLIASYYYDAKSKIHLFGHIKITYGKHEKEFESVEELNEYLASKKLPPFPLNIQ